MNPGCLDIVMPGARKAASGCRDVLLPGNSGLQTSDCVYYSLSYLNISDIERLEHLTSINEYANG